MAKSNNAIKLFKYAVLLSVILVTMRTSEAKKRQKGKRIRCLVRLCQVCSRRIRIGRGRIRRSPDIPAVTSTIYEDFVPENYVEKVSPEDYKLVSNDLDKIFGNLDITLHMTLAQKRRNLYKIHNRAKSSCNDYRDWKIKEAYFSTKNITLPNYTSVSTDIGCKLLKYQKSLQRSARMTISQMFAHITAQSDNQKIVVSSSSNKRKYNKRSTESTLESCKHVVKNQCCRMYFHQRNLIGYRFKRN